MTLQPIKFRYFNHRGQWSDRTVTPDSIEFFARPDFGYQPGWFLCGFDHEKNARRSFALSRIEVDFTEKRSWFSLRLEAGNA